MLPLLYNALTVKQSSVLVIPVTSYCRAYCSHSIAQNYCRYNNYLEKMPVAVIILNKLIRIGKRKVSSNRKI